MSRRRLLLGLGSAVTGVAATVAFVAPGAHAVDLGSFTVKARADALAVEVIDPAAPLFPAGQITDATPATAQAVVDSLGESTAFASAPYPGDALAGLPSLANGLGGGGGLPPIPAYPFLVSSSYPGTPAADQVQGPYQIHAHSTGTQSSGDAQLGAADAPPVVSSHATATASVDPGTGTLTATADDTTDGLAISSLLTVGEVSAHARLVSVPRQKPRLDSSFAVGTITVAGLTFGFTDRGLQLGSAVVPGASPEAFDAVLHQAGIDIAYLPATRTPTSVVSAGLSITSTNQVPSQGEVKVVVTLGRVSVQTSSVAAPSATATPPPTVTVAPSAGVAPPAAGSSVAPAPVPPAATPPSPVPLTPGRVILSVLNRPLVGHLDRWFFWALLATAAILLAAAAWSGRTGALPNTEPVLRLPASRTE